MIEETAHYKYQKTVLEMLRLIEATLDCFDEYNDVQDFLDDMRININVAIEMEEEK